MTCARSVDYATPKGSRPRSVQRRSIRCSARKRLIEYAPSSKLERESDPASLCMSVFE